MTAEKFFLRFWPGFCLSVEHLTVAFTIAELKFLACEKLQT